MCGSNEGRDDEMGIFGFGGRITGLWLNVGIGNGGVAQRPSDVERWGIGT